jgi:hypothetical protein
VGRRVDRTAMPVVQAREGVLRSLDDLPHERRVRGTTVVGVVLLLEDHPACRSVERHDIPSPTTLR